MFNQEYINEYFSKYWNGHTLQYVYSSEAILDKIKETDLVLDVGCGYNLFKGKIKNLLGIDPANTNADIVTTIEDFQPNQKFDVALCLGSINFGDDSIISKQLDKINNCLRDSARIFWRCNPGLHDHLNKECELIDFYPWSFNRLEYYADRYGFTQDFVTWDTNGKNQRIYAEWIR